MSDEGDALIGTAMGTGNEPCMLTHSGIGLGLLAPNPVMPAVTMRPTATRFLGSPTCALRGAGSLTFRSSGPALSLLSPGRMPLGLFVYRGIPARMSGLVRVPVRTRRLVCMNLFAESFEFLDATLGQPVQLAHAGPLDLIDLFLQSLAQLVDDLSTVTHERISREN